MEGLLQTGTSASRGSHAWQSPYQGMPWGCCAPQAVPVGGWGPGRCRPPPLHPPRGGGLCTTHPGDMITIETAALQRVENGKIRQGRKEGRVTRAVPVQLGQGSVPMCPRVSPQCQHGATGTYEALSTGTWDPSIRDLCVCQHSPRFVCFLPSVVQIFRFLKSARCFAEREGDCRSILGALKSL